MNETGVGTKKGKPIKTVLRCNWTHMLVANNNIIVNAMGTAIIVNISCSRAISVQEDIAR